MTVVDFDVDFLLVWVDVLDDAAAHTVKAHMVLLITVLAVEVAAVRERHCAAAVSRRWHRLCSVH